MGNNKKKKKSGTSNNGFLNKIKDSLIVRKYALIVLQSLFATLIGVCFFSYRASGVLYINDASAEVTSEIPSLEQLRGDYYESEIFRKNFLHATENLISYVYFRDEFETKGEYDPDKTIDLTDYVSDSDADKFDYSVLYNIADMVRWGQAGIETKYRTFATIEEYYDYFEYGNSISEEDINRAMYASPGKVYMLNCLGDRYVSTDGYTLGHYASNEETYDILLNAFITASETLYHDHTLYLSYKETYDAENTNMRYAYSGGSGSYKTFYTNVAGITDKSSPDKKRDTFKNMGKYLYYSQKSLDFLNNTPVEYGEIKDYINNRFLDFKSDAEFWISLDTEFPVDDVFASNYRAFKNTAAYIPWLVLVGALSLIGFVGLFFGIILNEKKRYETEDHEKSLTDFDRLPIEVSLLFFVLLVFILIISETMLVWNLSIFMADNTFNLPSIVLLFVDMIVILSFFYGYVKRVIYKNFWDQSITSLVTPFFKKYFGKIKRRWWFFYDDSNIIVRTWVSYLLFLVFNAFWALMLFFSNHPIISFTVLFVLDMAVGFLMSERNRQRRDIVAGIHKINDGDYNYQIELKKMHGENLALADAVNDIGRGIKDAVDISIKDEMLKASLITNVSHDIKTPLTSIINYVDLLKRENIEDEKIKKYIAVLDEKSQRLKTLTFDLVEASKISSGNITMEFARLNFIELISQSMGEFEEKFAERGLTVVTDIPKTPVFIMADPGRLWRVIENLFNNNFKYALENTRVYLDLTLDTDNNVTMSVKNISKQQLNIPAEELTERFIRGDVSRSTEGSGLGLSIAKNLTLLQNGDFNIFLEGDLFKVSITFPTVE